MADEKDIRTASNHENAHIGNTYNKEQINDEISLKELILKLKEWWKYLWSKWLTILIAGIIGGALGLAYALIKKPVYTAETTFVLEEGESGGGLSQYAGVASMLGVDLGGGGGGIFKEDNILELYKSRRMIQETLLTKDTFDGKEQSLIERYVEFNKLREGWEKNKKLAKIDFSSKPLLYNRERDSIMGKIVDAINKTMLEVIIPEKKSSIISVKVSSKDELFSKSFSDNIVNKVNQFYIDTKTKKSNENVAILQKQADSVKMMLNSSIGGVAEAMDENPNLNPAFQRLRVGSQRKQVDVQASGAIYQEIVKNLELAKITLRNEQPLIQLIDIPIYPLAVEKPGKAKSIILFGILFGVLAVFYLIARKIYLGMMEDDQFNG